MSAIDPGVLGLRESRSRNASGQLQCKQISIESPATAKECVFSFDVDVPDVPEKGARVKVMYVGACYRLQRSNSVTSTGSGSGGSLCERERMNSFGSSSCIRDRVSSFSSSSCLRERVGSFGAAGLEPIPGSPVHKAIRESSLYPGYEVAGIVDCIGEEMDSTPSDIQVGDHVIIYPYDDGADGYSEYVSVPDIKYLVKLPTDMPMSVAAMLPTGALWALNTLQKAEPYVRKIFSERAPEGKCNVLVVGTGSLALWALRVASYYFGTERQRVNVTVASLRDEGISIAHEFKNVSVVQWNEEVYEKQLIERTIDACGGYVDIVIDFCSTSRSLNRAIHCLSRGGHIFLGTETAEKLLPKFSRRAEDRGIQMEAVEGGSLEQLKLLVELVSSSKVIPPPFSVFPAEDACEVIKKICNAEIHGHAILQFS
ncbi:uncharacterized protein LOC136026389 isoform X2 [Artemia franciscana]|uniref:Enoyl reductase (ER) domain-containing protein n=2 Tax=Artemia franciscana TaxID=6661 RepID=A0AA88HV54_ARTSF|nr:hypothetical protein QYM36_012560 [Artemia franciscana]